MTSVRGPRYPLTSRGEDAEQALQQVASALALERKVGLNAHRQMGSRCRNRAWRAPMAEGRRSDEGRRFGRAA